jgi:hypothetical protein
MPETAEYTPHAPARRKKSFAQQLREETAGVRLFVSKFGARKALTRDQVAQAAVPFGADAHYLAATKRIVDTHYPAYLSVTKTISQARTWWRTMSVDFPIDGIRLIRKSLIDTFEQQMRRFRTDLNTHLNALEAFYPALRSEAEERLGSLFNADDYPATIRECFQIRWDYPSVDPPDYLKQLNPELYKQEQAKVAARFEEAIRAAEEAFASELQGLVSHLVDVLTPGPDGQAKALKKNAVVNVTEFVKKFRDMQVTDNAELTRLVDEADRILGGVDPADLRKQADMRQAIAGDMIRLRDTLSQLVVDRPERAIDLSDESTSDPDPQT